MLPQVVHVTEDQGHSFDIISPDLSRNDPKLLEKQADQSQRIKLEQKYMLLYSPYCETFGKGVIWTGSDDGLVHITKKQWSKLGEHLITNNSIA
jgi:hypothetical protein